MNQLEVEFLNMDVLASQSAETVAGTAFGMLTYWQDLPREQQLLGAAALFLKMCQGWNADEGSILRIASNVITKNQQLDTFQAMDAYILNELRS